MIDRVDSFMCSPEWKKMLNTLFLENTRLLYDGISRLHRQLSLLQTKGQATNVHASIKGMHKVRRRVGDTVKEQLEQCFAQEEPLYQNANISLCIFWEFFFKVNIRKQAVVVGDMILYYDLIQKLIEKSIEDDDKPYCYENLCWYICNLMSCDMSYFVCKDGCNPPRIICRSGYDIKELKHRSSPQGAEFGKLLSAEESGVSYITEDIWKISLIEEDNEKYVSTLRGHSYVTIRLDEGAGIFLLLQYNARDKKPQEELMRLLFMREDLTECICRDFENLMNLRFDCGFVRFFRDAEKKRAHHARPVIMHIADLHADESMRINQGKILSEFATCYNRLKKETKTSSVDLLILSGDIAEGKLGNASQLQKNYRTAEEILFKIVNQLWRRDDGRIPFDWKRRIMCVPGNHDFAAMNLVKASLNQRRLAAGLPYDGENEIFAKFAYYLDFSLQFLDAPIDALVRNNINETREYRNMNTKVLLLNTSWGSSAARTNKVCLDEMTVNRLVNEKIWCDCEHSSDPYRICVLHHPPKETLDYIRDGYDIPNPEWSWAQPAPTTAINPLYESFCEVVRLQLKKKPRKCKLESAKRQFISDFESRKDIVTQLNIRGDNQNKIFFTKDAYLEYNYIKTGARHKSEELSRIHERMRYDKMMAALDQRTFQNVITRIDSAHHVNVYLCGHIHTRNNVSDIAWKENNIEKKV